MYKINTMIEKIWKNVLIYLTLLIFVNHIINFYEEYRVYREVKDFYEKISSIENNPIGFDKEKIEKIKIETIQNIKESEQFNKLGKDFILDSLQSAKIKILEPKGYLFLKKTTAAFFIQLGDFEESIKNDFLLKRIEPSPYKNLIIINKKYLEDDDLPEILTHEIYHYVDALFGDDKYLSDKLNLSEFIDKNIIDNKSYLKKKASIIFNIVNTENEELKNLSNKLSLSTIKNVEYLSNNREIFARWKTFKTKLIQKGYIENINSDVTLNIVLEYCEKSRTNIEDFNLLLVIDLDKIEELDSLLK